ncbi:transmembrane protein 135 isoform X2 [Sipha flava]|uniref:Transmembrane protein 135 isoform X2 n=1 Tax=Sipha flava TaxID=143950 RepID=A0A8B8F271_9HEMI|nr:transmembrane protein 135 isoform X2 [Sipha flava]
MVFSKNIARASCADILHPWTQNCSLAHRTMMRTSLLGSSKLLVPLILVDYLLKLRKKKGFNKDITRETIINIIRSLTMGMCITTSFLIYSCTLRNLLGRFTHPTIVFIPGFLSGLSYVILQPKMKVQIFTALCNAALESVVLRTSRSGLLCLNIYIETLFFMITNACLMYAVKTSKFENPKYTWFFKPDKCQQTDKEQVFLKTIFKKTINYFGLGLSFGILRMLIKDVSILAPRNIHKMFDMSTLRSGIFTGSYVAVYEFTIYILNRYFQKDQSIHALPAGFLAGLSYAISPSLTINLSAFINLIQIMYNRIDVVSFRHIPMDTIVFCLSVGVLYHIQLFYPRSTSKVGSKYIKMVTGKRSNLMIEGLKKMNYNIY